MEDNSQMLAYILRLNAMAFMCQNMNIAKSLEHQRSQDPEIVLEGKDKKYSRTWSKEQIQEVYSVTLKYCSERNKNIEDLSRSDFDFIAKGFPQSGNQIMIKINEIHKTGTLKPGVWSSQEDKILVESLESRNTWGNIAKKINSTVHNSLQVRSGKQCKERWNNYLNPEINRGSWTQEEDCKLLECYREMGKKWSMVSKVLKNRTESAVKNRVKSLINRIKQDLEGMEDISSGITKYLERLKNENLGKRED